MQILIGWSRNRAGENKTGEPRPHGHFCEHFRGHLRGTFRSSRWVSLKGLNQGKATLVSALVGAFVGALVGGLVAHSWIIFRFRLLRASPICLQLDACCLQWGFLLTIVFGSFLLTAGALLLIIGAFLLTVGKCFEH